jgi:demethylmenaquinone methyltransferase/2-methoxy-6-polyprenyl-1,4-benzoquinol methylase
MDATELFAPLGPSYDRWGSVLSFGQDPRWRRFLVTRIDAAPTDTVLDVATGTAAVALELVRQKDCFVVGVDRTPEMLEEGRHRVALAAATRNIRLQEADARSLPFEDGQFDALTFTYLLRYVDDPAATLAQLARVVKPGGTIAGLEFALPRGVWRPLWELWTRVGLPMAGTRSERFSTRRFASSTNGGPSRASSKRGARRASRRSRRGGSASAAEW